MPKKPKQPAEPKAPAAPIPEAIANALAFVPPGPNPMRQAGPEELTEMMLKINGRDLQVIRMGLEELPAKVSRETLNSVDAQVAARLAAHAQQRAAAPK